MTATPVERPFDNHQFLPTYDNDQPVRSLISKYVGEVEMLAGDRRLGFRVCTNPDAMAE